MERNDPAYHQIGELARTLTRAGFIVASGGGPGAMEATHLGAACANAPDATLTAAIKVLSSQKALPEHLDKIVDAKGVPDPEIAAKAHAWLKVAFKALKLIPNPAESLALPTWRYGHEPSTPFASHIAKYFQNSIREDGLVSIGMNGVVFAPGKAGTIQEIFQNVTNNFYHLFGTFSPMVFLGKDHWTKAYPIVAVLEKLFTPSQIKKYVLVTDSTDEAAEFIANASLLIVGSPHPSFQLRARASTSPSPRKG